MNTFLKQSLTLAALLLVSLSFVSSANAEGLRIRGEITALSNNVASIETSSGQHIDVFLAPHVTVLLFKDVSFEDIPSNAYLSIPSVPAGPNKRRALGINIFPEGMRGANEGLSDWDLTSDSKMTNATLAKVISTNGKNNRELLVSFAGETQQILVPEGTQITSFSPTDKITITVGQKVVIFAQVADGKLTGGLVGIHENGELPPI